MQRNDFRCVSLIFLSVLLTVMMAIPIVYYTHQDEANKTPDFFLPFMKNGTPYPTMDTRAEENTRHGFTINQTWSSSDTFIVRDVSTGDIDGDGDVDIVSCGDTACVVYKNDGTGQSFTKGWTASGLTGVATQVEVVKADSDADLDIVLVTQAQVPAAGAAAVAGNVIVRVYLNSGTGTFTEAASSTIAAMFFNSHDYYGTGYTYMATGDMDHNGNVDIAVAVPEGAAGTVGNITTFHVLSFNGVDTLTDDATRKYYATSSGGWYWGNVAWGNLDGDNYDDLVACLIGWDSGSSNRPATVFYYRSTSGGLAAKGAEKNVGEYNVQTAAYGNFIYSVAVGDVSNDGKGDIIVGTNYNLGGAYADGMVHLIAGNGDGTFAATKLYYDTSITNRWQPRDIDLGTFDVDAGLDLVANFWYDSATDDFVIDQWSIQISSGRPTSPIPKFKLKSEFRTSMNLAATQVLCCGKGDFDKLSPLIDDVVYGGDKTYVLIAWYPPNNLPQIKNYTFTKNPILNDGADQTTINISVSDPDGLGDLNENSVTIDLRPVGGAINSPVTYKSYDGANSRKYYHITTNVTKASAPGIIKLPVTITDTCMDMYPGPSPGITNDNITLTVQQYNRAPTVNSSALTEINLLEDQGLYRIGDLNDYFDDLDGDTLSFDLGSAITNEFDTTILKAIYNDDDASVNITTKQNKHGTTVITMRAHDGHAHTTAHLLTVNIASVNDAPIITDTGSGTIKNNTFDLTQDLKFETDILATDVDLDAIHYSIVFPDDAHPLFTIGELNGHIEFTPLNIDVGEHKAVITVRDGNLTLPGESSKIFYFNVTNWNDRPYFIKIGGIEIDKNTTHLTFDVVEHEWLNITLIAADPDIDIGLQEEISFSSSLSILNESFGLEIDDKDNKKAEMSFRAEGKGVTCTVPEKGYGPIQATLTVTDALDYLLKSSFNISINISNVNDPPTAAKIDTPEENTTYHVMTVEFVAGVITDPDIIYGDELRYVWDFDDSDGTNGEDAVGLQPKWIYKETGDYVVTLTVFDKMNLSTSTHILIHVYGDPKGEDSDQDGLPDTWEKNWKLDPYDSTGDNGASGDPDKDGVPNSKEYERKTDPFSKDSDGDGVWDNDDEFPNDNTKWKTEEAKKDYTWLVILIIIIIVLIIIVVVVIVLIVVYRKKKKEEEEEARKAAEAAAAHDQYANQNIYSNLPPIQQPAPTATPPPQPSEQLQFEKPADVGSSQQLMGPPPAQGLPPGPTPPQGQQPMDVHLPPQQPQGNGPTPPPALPPMGGSTYK